MVEQCWWNRNGGTLAVKSNGGAVVVEELWWNRNVEQYWLNSSGGTVMVEEKCKTVVVEQ